MGALQKKENSLQTLLLNFVACKPNPYKLSILGDIFEELPFCHFPLPKTSIRSKDSQI